MFTIFYDYNSISFNLLKFHVFHKFNICLHLSGIVYLITAVRAQQIDLASGTEYIESF